MVSDLTDGGGKPKKPKNLRGDSCVLVSIATASPFAALTLALGANHEPPAGWPTPKTSFACTTLLLASLKVQASGLTFKWTTWENDKAENGTRHAGSWDEFVGYLDGHARIEVGSKAEAPLWSAGTFKGERRNADGAEAVFAIVLDADDDKADWRALLGLCDEHGIAYFAHRSLSHSTIACKWRVVFPLAAPISGADLERWKTTHKNVRVALASVGKVWFNPLLGGVDQAWFPPLRLEGTERRETRIGRGSALDLAALAVAVENACAKADVPAVVKPAKAPTHQLTSNATALIMANTRLIAYFRGTGKVPDPSPQGYDSVLLECLLKAGASDEDCVSAMLARPGGHAMEQGEAFARDMVSKAIAARAKSAKDADEKEFQQYVRVDSMLRRTSNPVVLVLEIDGKKITISIPTLNNATAFQNAVGNASLPIPQVPSGKTYLRWINWLLSKAVDEEAPDEASEEAGERIAIGGWISGLGLGETATQMLEGSPCPVGDGSGDYYMGLDALLKRLRAEMPRLTRPTLSHHLHTLGWVPATPRFDGKKVRCWRGKL